MAAILTLPFDALRQLVRGLCLLLGHRLMPLPLLGVAWYLAAETRRFGDDPTPVFIAVMLGGVVLNRLLHRLGTAMAGRFKFSGRVERAPKEAKPPKPQWAAVAVRRHSTPGHRAIVRQLPKELRGLLQ